MPETDCAGKAYDGMNRTGAYAFFYCSYMAYFFGEIPTAFVKAFKKLL